MKLNNPATFFVTGSDQEEYTYVPGSDPYYVIARSPGYILLSVLVFANSPDHAKQIVTGMVDFQEKCDSKYTAYDNEWGHHDKHGLHEQRKRKIIALRAALAEGRNYTLHIGLASKDQMYKVSWASNDT